MDSIVTANVLDRNMVMYMYLAADKTLLVNQLRVIRLVTKLSQVNVYREQVEEGNNYDIEAHISSYKVRTAIKTC